MELANVINVFCVELFRVYVVNIFDGLNFGRRKTGNFGYWLILLTATLSIWGTYVLASEPIYYLSRCIGTFIVAIPYEGEKRRKIVVSWLIFCAGIAFDALVYAIFAGGRAIKGYESVASAISILILLFGVIMLRQTMSKNSIFSGSSNWIAFLIIPGLGAVVLPMLVASDSISKEATIYVCISLVVLNLVVYYLYESLINAYGEKMKNMQLAEQLETYEKQLRLGQETENRVRIMRHDMTNHIIELQNMCKAEKYKELYEYLDSMQKSMQIKEIFVNTGNYVIDGVINYKMGFANRKGIKTILDIVIPSDLVLSSFDMNCLLGNLLDNAIEGVEGVEKPYIDFAMKYISGCLIIRIINPYKKVWKDSQRRYITMKKNGMNHGYGLLSIQQIVDKYGGSLHIDDCDNRFLASVEIMV